MFSGGELVYLDKWKTFDLDQFKRLPGFTKCNCGERLWDCPVWSPLSYKEENRIKSRFNAVENARIGIGAILGPYFAQFLGYRASENRSFYNGIFSLMKENSYSSRLLTDSSKDPRRFFDLIVAPPDQEVVLIYLTRDPREYLYTHLKKSRPIYKKRKTAFLILLEWVSIHFVSRRLWARFGGSKARISYKDLTDDTANTLNELGSILNISIQREGLEKRINESKYHIVNGNHMKRSDVRPITFEVRWKKAFSPLQRAMFNSLSFPFRWMDGRSLYRAK